MSAGDIPKYGHDFRAYGLTLNYDGLIGYEKVWTSFGEKNVKIILVDYYSGHENGKDEIVVADVGVDSHITYRWTVSSSSGAYH